MDAKNKYEIIDADYTIHCNIIKNLFIEYASGLGFSLDFQDFGHELINIENEYFPPTGYTLLLKFNNQFIGCVAIRKFEGNVCEMKRMYIKQGHRGKGYGKKLAQEIIKIAKLSGYDKIRLDTISNMSEAIAIYKKMGFKEIEPYRFNPIEGVVFMELSL